MKTILILGLLLTTSFTTFSQEVQKTDAGQPHAPTYSYAYITVTGVAFSKRLSTQVDLGDTPEQIKTAKEYSDILSNKKSYAAILNYMAEREFELVETRDYSLTSQGADENMGMIIIMRKKNN